MVRSTTLLTMTDEQIDPHGPPSYGLTSVFWGNGKGKTTAAIGLGMRAVGHGYRVHLLQFMKRENDHRPTPGEYQSIDRLTGFSYETTGEIGWHQPGRNDKAHQAQAEAGLERARELLVAAGQCQLEEPLPLDGDPEDGMHMLILDEILYAVERELLDQDQVQDVIAASPDNLELVLTGGHERPAWMFDAVDLVTETTNHKHPLQAGRPARQGFEY